MEQEVYTSDITGATIAGARYLMEVRKIKENGTIDEEFGVRAYDMEERDLTALGLAERGRRYSVRGRRSKDTGSV